MPRRLGRCKRGRREVRRQRLGLPFARDATIASHAPAFGDLSQRDGSWAVTICRVPAFRQRLGHGLFCRRRLRKRLLLRSPWARALRRAARLWMALADRLWHWAVGRWKNRNWRCRCDGRRRFPLSGFCRHIARLEYVVLFRIGDGDCRWRRILWLGAAHLQAAVGVGGRRLADGPLHFAWKKPRVCECEESSSENFGVKSMLRFEPGAGGPIF